MLDHNLFNTISLTLSIVGIGQDRFKVFNGVFDEYTLKSLEVLKRKGYFDVLGQCIKTGKEADVYLARKGEELRAVKIYRMTSANFKKISSYIQRDYRFKDVKGNVRNIILKWVQKEFRNLLICHKANVSVPFPYKCNNNIIVMEFVQGLMLKDTDLVNPETFLTILLEQLKLLRYEAKMVHADLSEFNILVRDQVPVIIDLGQAMTVKNGDDFEQVRDLYTRDIEQIAHYFSKVYKLDVTTESLLKKLEKD